MPGGADRDAPPRRRALAWIAAAAIAAAASPFGTALAEASPFEWRGVVQGHYGPPFSHAERSRLIQFIGTHGFNAYLNAPKDDPYQREAWRTPYPTGQMVDFVAEIQQARTLGVRWIPSLSPDRPRHPVPLPAGVSPSGQICFSCPADRRALLDKFEPFRLAGAATFAIGFDDFEQRLTHAVDHAAFGSGAAGYGRANAYLLNRVYAALRAREPSARLLTVPADYQGTRDSAYLRGLRSRLGPGIEVMWTGPMTRARDFSPGQARAFAALIARRPLVWDNWVNNDGSATDGAGLPTRLFQGPYRRRPDIAGDVRGFFLNAATEPDLNLLPLATAGDWMTAPWSYRAHRSFRLRLDELGGSRASTLRAFAETGYATELIPRVEAPTFTSLAARFLATYRAGGTWRRPRRRLDAELGLARGAGDRLGADPALARFVEEARPFLGAARKRARAGMAATALLAAERPALALTGRGPGGFRGHVSPPHPGTATRLRASLAADERAIRRDPHVAYGGRTRRYRLAANALDGFLSRAQGIDSRWRTAASGSAVSVVLRLGRTPVQVNRDGSFRLPHSACGRLLTATASVGGATSLRLPACS